MKKRYFSTLLALCITLSLLPTQMTAYAAGSVPEEADSGISAEILPQELDSEPEPEAETEPEQALEPESPAAADDGQQAVLYGESDTFGDGLTWGIENGTLTISGKGSMRGASPWKSSSDFYAIKTVVIETGVTDIGNNAFTSCSSLTSVTIPSSVASIGTGVFGHCTNLAAIQVDTSNKNYAAIDGILFTAAKDQLIAYPAGRHEEGYSIPSSVTRIWPSAFLGCRNLKIVTIPEGVTSIEEHTFYGCSSLFNVYIPESVASIGDSAFNGCSSLTNVSIPKSVTSIGESAFAHCGLTKVTIPESVASIEDYVFYNCRDLTSVTIPESVTSIGVHAFSASVLTSVTIPESVTSIREYAFFGCSKLTGVTIPKSTASIGDYAFADCSGLAKVAISEGVTSIGEYAFIGSSNLKDIQVAAGNKNYAAIDGILFTAAGDQLMVYPAGREGAYTIPSSVTRIWPYAFGGRSLLTSVTIPASVTSMGDSAFSGCSGLTRVTIPEGVTSIEDSTFAYCSGLTSVTIPEGVTSIGDSAFSGCSGLTRVTIPESVTSIGSYAIDYCNRLKDVYYYGTEAQWKAVAVDSSNTSLLNATIHFTCVAEIVSVTNEGAVLILSKDLTGTCYVALFDTNGRMLAARSTPVSADTGRVSVSYGNIRLPDTYRIKVMLLDGKMVPLSSAYSAICTKH